MERRHARTLFAGVFAAFIALCVISGTAAAADVKLNTTADHSKFKELQGPFASAPDVTKACLGCHTEAAGQIRRTKHWTWEYLNPESGQRLGKKNVVNNFCISVPSNYPFCTTCHVGYGWKDANYDFSADTNVDCLVCHDTTGAYKKFPGKAGHPLYADIENPPGSGKIAKAVDLPKVAQKVGKTSRDTCGACHFFGGGGDGVKHGDLDSSLSAPDKEVDVHMDATGLDFTCGTCHQTSAHDVPGSRYAVTGRDKGGAHIRGDGKTSNPATCVACHGNAPHKAEPKAAKLNHHADKLACQTCHVPAMARGGVPTKMSWDWSTAGKVDADGKQFSLKDEHGHVTYASHKGDFKLADNAKPRYQWFNGEVTYTLVTDKVEKSDTPVAINTLHGSAADGKSLIWPVKVFDGVQPYDPENKTLVRPHVAGNDDTAFWKNLVWDKAIAAGMSDAGLPFSGKVDFLKTTMAWPITHMVAPKQQALACDECHTPDGGRLAGIDGVYLPARDRIPLLDLLLGLIVAATAAASLTHGAIRLVAHFKRRS
ncbi:MAG: tetrathionate reductase family octaheme c-type cytochrome [Magnetospirillum sp.]|nr:tetrathionate reductase family octaheme c-type cytochrome [Magnetospirillum sp.]